MPESIPNLLTIEETAARLKWAHDTVRRLIYSGGLVGTRIGGSVRVAESDLLDYINQGRNKGRRPYRKKKTPGAGRVKPADASALSK
jgi:excisionase family DNA binding protein